MKTAFTTSTVLVLLGLATSACIGVRKGTGAEAPAAPESLTHEHVGEAQPGGEESTHDAGHGAVAPQGDHGHSAAGSMHELAMRSHGAGNHPQGGPALQIGEEVKDIALTDNTGEAFRLGTLRKTEKSRGKIAVLTFWCTTCSSCRRIEHDFNDKAKEYETQDAVFLMVDSNYTDNAQGVNQFLENNELGFRVLMDPLSEIARYFGATLTTTTAVIDPKGRLRYYGGFAGAEDAVRSLIAGADVVHPLNPGSG